MNGSVLAGVHRRKIMCRFLDGQRVSTRVYVHTTANEAEKAAGGRDGSVIVFQTPHLSVVVRDVLLNHCNVFSVLPSEHCGYNYKKLPILFIYADSHFKT